MADDLLRFTGQSQARFGQRLIYAHNTTLAVKAVERPCQIVSKARDALRRVISRRSIHLIGIFCDQLNKRDLCFIRQPCKFGLRLRFRRQPDFFRLPKNTGDSGVRVLHVINGILIRLLSRSIEIKIKLAVQRAHDEEITRRIGTDFFHELRQRHTFPGSLRHLHRLAAAIQADHLQK